MARNNKQIWMVRYINLEFVQNIQQLNEVKKMYIHSRAKGLELSMLHSYEFDASS
jgi:hypothetical protein